MAERSKAPDSRVELFLTGVFWSTNVGVGSIPTSDNCLQISKNKRLLRAIWTSVLRYELFKLLWRNWLARSTVNRKVDGSSPSRSDVFGVI